MPWVKLDEAMPEHEKVIGLPDRAFRAHIEAICYAARNLTDGRIPRDAAKRAGWLKSTTPLVSARLWEVTDGGWVIHDYLRYNPSREAVETERTAARERMANVRRSSGDVRSNNPRSSGDVRSTRSDPTPTPVAEPIMDEDDPPQSPPPLRIEFWNRGCKLRGLISLSPLDESLLDTWIEDGATIADWDAAASEIAGWQTPPEFPWGAFKSAMGNRMSRAALPEQRPVPLRPQRGVNPTAGAFELTGDDAAEWVAGLDEKRARLAAH